MAVSQINGCTTLSQTDKKRLQEAEDKQRQLRETVKNGKFTQAEQNALTIDHPDDFQAFWRETLRLKSGFDRDHEHGAGRIAKGATSFGATAHDVLNAFSPMVDVVKDFGHPYGAMAIGTVCFVFAIAKSRAAMEDQINSTLQDIRDRLPGVKLYKHIYNDNHELDQQLQSKILNAYDKFITFCVAAVEYFTRGSLRRLRSAVVNTGHLDECATAVQKAIVDVRIVCEELLSKNVDIIKNTLNEVKLQSDEIQRQNVEVQLQNDALKRQIEELQRGRDVESLEKICKLLGLVLSNDISSRSDHMDELARHEQRVNHDFGPKNWLQAKSHTERLAAVESDIEYQKWLVAPESSLLILSGHNHYAGAHHCWLSPVAHRLIKKQTTPGGEINPDTCIFYLLGLQETDDTCVSVMAMLILRLLSLNKAMLRKEDHFTDLCAELASYVPPSADLEDRSREMQKVLQKVAVKVLNMLGEGTTVWIVLDRVDKCRPSPSRKSRSQYRKDGLALLRTMVYLVEHSKTTVKILTVVNGSCWKVEEDVDDLDYTDEKVIVRSFDQ